MPIRTVKQYSDRGSLSALKEKVIDESEPITLIELRMQSLYDYACKNNDINLKDSLGFITTDYISDKNALPLSVYRIRKIVADIKSKSSQNIDALSLELSQCFGSEISNNTAAYLQKNRIKTASAKKPASFWRASKK